MKFAHMSDCHVGGWREEKLKELSINAFEQAVDECIKENVAFVLISGDFFNILKIIKFFFFSSFKYLQHMFFSYSW